MIDQAGNASSRVVTTTVTFKRLTHAEIDDYIESGEWAGKAGGYAIQGKAAIFIRRLNGSYTNVVGLPLHEVYTLHDGHGLWPRGAPS